ncbi:hypothetical protein H6G51_12850 [Limnothrix sp. FACHB-708]|uniref:hypothetical protein n=1 Tax=unclassified Limnothrix TaxID=2632864 RepID=UPI0016817303|nr:MULTISPECIES: hypothetical protein [unclassified Limnothrix]MBD2160359.1 hypothetical protein [Limnothrix sp. FACHB-1083]MBD2191060.1 hypothetical protein [Limnothrix sp. FACHB-1088]MBD2554171.1 hypothetical protein [Limnothrix sp. FACHB-708]MBD2591053.1 hypothetical protein [Limnothrix sp. FACHB-406]
MTGLTPFSIESSEQFQRSFKKLVKATGQVMVSQMTFILEQLMDDPHPPSSRQEPLPSRFRLPDNWTFHKLELKVGRGASGQIRLMYLVDAEARIIRLVWLYSHEQFAKRPSDPDLRNVLKAVID